ncbi:MAG TPA: hypothetical protein VJB99_01740 [Patescibacteria group bacterium]|nr:hypothetical protein [Patescibacteria group bacterium]
MYRRGEGSTTDRRIIDEQVKGVEDGETREKREKTRIQRAEFWFFRNIVPTVAETIEFPWDDPEIFRETDWSVMIADLDTRKKLRRELFEKAEERTIKEMRDAVAPYLQYVLDHFDVLNAIHSSDEESSENGYRDEERGFIAWMKSAFLPSFSESLSIIFFQKIQ